MPEHRYFPPSCGPDAIYVDDSLIVIDKPSGLLSVPGRGVEKSDCAISRIQNTYPDALTVHRLDMDTSGLLVFGRGTDNQRELSKQFEQGRIEKTYIADVWGMPSPKQGMIDLPLIADWPNRPLQKVDHEIGKPSQTRFCVTGQHDYGARLELIPLTGRSHQLRVHMASIGHPILGDVFYASAEAKDSRTRLCLHAACISIIHPVTGEQMSFDCPLPF